jgi:hypothetical protein
VKWLNSNRLWWLASLSAALAAPPLLLRAEPEGFDAKRGRVSAMPQTERDRLTRNFEEYLKLTEAQREHYRLLHESLQRDQVENGGRCVRAKEDYFAWVSGLPAYQQQKLLATTVPSERIELVAKYAEEQELRRLEEEQRKLGPRFGGFYRFTPRLSPSELAVVMAELERGVALSAEQQRQLDEKPAGIDRYLEFFKIIGTERRPPLKITDIVNGAKVEQLMEKLPQRARERLNRPTPQERTGALIFTITSNLRFEIESQIRARQPDADKLQEFVAHWPEDQQDELDELMDLSPDEFIQRVREKYAAQNLELDFEHIRRTYPPDWPGARRPGSGGPRPPGESGDTRRGPPSND